MEIEKSLSIQQQPNDKDNRGLCSTLQSVTLMPNEIKFYFCH